MRIKPLGSKLLVLPQEKKNFVTESNIEIVENVLAEAKVLEVSDEYSGVIKQGDIVCYASEAGKPQKYKGQSCLWIDARPIALGGDLWFLIEDDDLNIDSL